MLSSADLSLVKRDRELEGLAVLLNPADTTRLLRGSGVVYDQPLRAEYLRYKPGQYCTSLVRLEGADADCFTVLTAFSARHYEKQLAITRAATSEGRCWQIASLGIRIDNFPFDPTLKHISKCVDSNDRQRMLRRVKGRGSQIERFSLKTMAYKPGRRYVAAGIVDTDTPSTNQEPSYTLKFYSGIQFRSTLQRLHCVQSAGGQAPKIRFHDAHYSVLMLEWVHGQLFADLISNNQAGNSCFFRIGCELARLHKSPVLEGDFPLAAPHRLTEIARYINSICPEHSSLANQTVNQIVTRLRDARQSYSMIHGDFYAKQVLMEGDAVRFIDFDSAGWGNPYQDVGNFVAKLYWQFQHQNQNLANVAEFVEPFLEGYCNVNGDFDEFAYRTYLAAGLVRCATHPFRHAHPSWPKAICQLLKLAQSSLRAPRSLRNSATTT